MPGSGQGVAAGWLRAGRAALQSLLGSHGDLQHHTGHAVVGVAGRLSLIPVLQWTQDQCVEFRIKKAKVVGSVPCAAQCIQGGIRNSCS